VTLALDTSSPIRSRARYRELAQAILDAPPATQETDYLEWKSEVDLGEKRWQAEFGRHILGFANRDPDSAARWFAGCAYLVAGVTPGSLVGTKLYDADTIDAWLSAYVGQPPGAPQWAANYIDLDGKQVVVVTIEAPEPGDRMWVCQREFSSNDGRREKLLTRRGAIYVRHQASTDEAGPADIEMLSRRLMAGQRRLSGLVLLAAIEDTAQPLDTREEAIAAWIERERQALQPPVTPEAQRPPSTTNEPVLTIETGSDDGAGETDEEDVPSIKRGLKVGDLAGIVAEMYERDERTGEDYAAEVEEYLAKCAEVLPDLLKRRALEHELGRLRLAIRNKTDEPLQAVQVEVSISTPGVWAAYSRWDVADVTLPKRPIMLGKKVRAKFASGLTAMHLANLRAPDYRSLYSPGLATINRGVSIDNSGSTHLVFDPVDLYARDTSVLSEIYLYAPHTLAGEKLTANWSARARDVGGVHEDSLLVDVSSDVPTIDELLAEPEEGED
jgi:hypothetical protein